MYHSFLEMTLIYGGNNMNKEIINKMHEVMDCIDPEIEQTYNDLVELVYKVVDSHGDTIIPVRIIEEVINTVGKEYLYIVPAIVLQAIVPKRNKKERAMMLMCSLSYHIAIEEDEEPYTSDRPNIKPVH